MEHSMKLLTNSDIHNYYTRNNDMFQGVYNETGASKKSAINSLDKETQNVPSK